ncbi:hypothetical protein E4U53_002439 [Claviceps sorghi]|nr:hypothetical protein E4U53_002439 [Claviceps sorghi]
MIPGSACKVALASTLPGPLGRHGHGFILLAARQAERPFLRPHGTLEIHESIAPVVLMAPPAKRRRPHRNPLEASDDENGPPRANTLSNFLLSSPSSPSSPSKPRGPTSSPRPLTTRNTGPFPAANTSPTKTRRGTSQKNGASPASTKTRDVGSIDNGGRTADLKTLFSKQAQRATKASTSSSTSTSGVKRPSPVHDPISDPISEDDEISELRSSSSSLVGQHARKRLRKSPQVVPGESSSCGPQFLRPARPTSSHPGVDDELRPWSERFGPRNLDELAVHKKKVADVRRWLDEVMTGRRRQRLLILKGAAGSGKTTTMRLLAKDMGFELLEWKNPTPTIMGTGFVSSSAQFGEFLGRGGKFGMLDIEASTDSSSTWTSSNGAGAGTNRAERVILVEEFPNTFSQSSSALSSFRSTILQYLADLAPSPANLSNMMPQPTEPIRPVVLVITETLLTTTSASADSLTAHRLLGPEILRHPGVAVIEFNAIAPTILAKALELVVLKEARKSGRRRTPGPQVLKRLGDIGDIRSAVSSLEFLCLKGDEESDWGAKVAFTKLKKSPRDSISLTKGESESLELISQREASLGIFHAVGKVVYNKRDEAAPADDAVEDLPSYLSQYARPKRSQVSVDALIDETGTDTHTFISALHENYILSCESTGPMDLSTPMDYVNECIEYLSESDLLCPSRDVFFRGGRGGFGARDASSHALRQDEMTFQVAVRGLLFALPNPVKRKTGTTTAKGSDAFRMFYPASLKLWRAKEEIEGMVDLWSTRILKGESHLGATKNMTDGATAFLSKTPSSAGTDPTPWTRRRQKHQSKDGAPTADTSAPPLLALGSAAQREMLLDRLPYMAHMARARKTTSLRLGDLEKVVCMTGPSAVQDDSDTPDVGPGEAWATDPPAEASPRRKRPGIHAGVMSGLLAQKLVLSDDDIEE